MRLFLHVKHITFVLLLNFIFSFNSSAQAMGGDTGGTLTCKNQTIDSTQLSIQEIPEYIQYKAILGYEKNVKNSVRVKEQVRILLNHLEKIPWFDISDCNHSEHPLISYSGTNPQGFLIDLKRLRLKRINIGELILFSLANYAGLVVYPDYRSQPYVEKVALRSFPNPFLMAEELKGNRKILTLLKDSQVERNKNNQEFKDDSFEVPLWCDRVPTEFSVTTPKTFVKSYAQAIDTLKAKMASVDSEQQLLLSDALNMVSNGREGGFIQQHLLGGNIPDEPTFWYEIRCKDRVKKSLIFSAIHKAQEAFEKNFPSESPLKNSKASIYQKPISYLNVSDNHLLFIDSDLLQTLKIEEQINSFLREFARIGFCFNDGMQCAHEFLTYFKDTRNLQGKSIHRHLFKNEYHEDILPLTTVGVFRETISLIHSLAPLKSSEDLRMAELESAEEVKWDRICQVMTPYYDSEFLDNCVEKFAARFGYSFDEELLGDITASRAQNNFRNFNEKYKNINLNELVRIFHLDGRFLIQ